MIFGARSAWTKALLCLPALACSPTVPTEQAGHLAQPLDNGTRQWFITRLVPTDDAPQNQFGSGVALSAGTAVVAAPGVPAAYVFVLADDGWHQQAKLEPPKDFAEKAFATSLAVSGDIVLVGAPADSSSMLPGAAYIYERSGTTWSAPVTLTADDGIASDEFGYSVAIDGDTALVGAYFASIGDPDAGTGAGYEGAAYVFTRSGSSWKQTKKLSASDGLTDCQFGDSVAISGTNILVGASHWPGDWSGAAYLYSTTDWKERKLRPADAFQGDEFGHSVALGGGLAVVGAHSHRGRDISTGYRQGAAFVYPLSGADSATPQELLPDDGEDLDRFGTTVGVSGNTVMVGAPRADTVYVFDAASAGTVADRLGQRGEIVAFGGSLQLDGDIVAVGSDYGQNGAYVAELLGIDGSSCDSDSECRARHCVDGVCCNTSCSGACETCSTGSCTATPQSPGTPSCSPYLCNESGGACPSQCVAHGDCIDTHYCSNHTCTPRVPNGAACSEAQACVSGRCIGGQCGGSSAIGERCQSASDCESGFCVDGYCCDQRCAGQCEACDVHAKHGICTTISGPPHGDHPPCSGAGTICGGSCDGDHSSVCSYPTASTGCGSSCTDGVETDSSCDGQGECQAGEPQSCGNFACQDEAICKTRCLDIRDCMSGFTCQNGRCESGAACLDEQTAQSADGVVDHCAPYLCDNGSCKTQCDAADDCTLDSVCDPKHRCVPRPEKSEPHGSEGGCNVAVVSDSGTAPAVVSSALFALFALVRRRRSGLRPT